MLTFQNTELREALVEMPVQFEKQAIQAYKDILGWMGDRPLPFSQRSCLSEELVAVAKSEEFYGEELYMQIMKQLTNNPSSRSIAAGWELLGTFCKEVTPSDSIEGFLRVFVMQTIADLKATIVMASNVDAHWNADEEKRKEQEKILAIARHCLSALNDHAAVGSDRRNGETIPVQVLMIDNNCRKVTINKNTTLGDLGEVMAKTIGVSNSKDFCFFQLTENIDTHRLLPDNLQLDELSDKWIKLKNATGRSSRLLYKRRMFKVTETLDEADMVHATLSYRQMIWEYLNYPICEDMKLIAEIAATLVCTELDYFWPLVQEGRLGEPGQLEQVLPHMSLKNQTRQQWAQQISDTCIKMEEALDKQETKYAKMSRVVSSFQRMSLFGTFHWVGKQIFDVRDDRVSVPEAPPQNCKINPQDPEAEYWICVDIYGVRFVSVNSPPGDYYTRGFLFCEGALERVMRWGARRNVVQFVVHTVNSARQEPGRVPMTISLLSPAAIDIAYAIYVICRPGQ
jgi:hypothetical protein